MSRLETLQAELSTDPLGIGYAAMVDQQVADSLNAQVRSGRHKTLHKSEIYDAFDPAEWQGIESSADQAEALRVDRILGLDDPILVDNNSLAVVEIKNIFGAGSKTVANLTTALTIPKTRAAEIGLPFIEPGYVTQARA